MKLWIESIRYDISSRLVGRSELRLGTRIDLLTSLKYISALLLVSFYNLLKVLVAETLYSMKFNLTIGNFFYSQSDFQTPYCLGQQHTVYLPLAEWIADKDLAMINTLWGLLTQTKRRCFQLPYSVSLDSSKAKIYEKTFSRTEPSHADGLNVLKKVWFGSWKRLSVYFSYD